MGGYWLLFHLWLIGQGTATPYSLEDTTMASKFVDIADSLLEQAQYDSSILYFQRASEIYSTVADSVAVDSLLIEKSMACRNKVGKALRDSGRYREAERYLAQVLEEGLTELGEMNRIVASTYDIMGINYWYKGDYERALQYLEHGLRIRSAVLGNNSLEVAASLDHLGILYDELGEYDKALEYYHKSNAISIELEGKSLSLANGYNNVAVVYGNKGDYTKALEYCKKDLNLTIALIGEKNLGVANTYNNIGVINTRLQKFRVAMRYFRKAESIALLLVNERHPLVIRIYINIADLLVEQMKLNTAIGYYQEVLKTGKTFLGNLNPLMAIASHGLAKAYFDDGQLLNALSYCQKALMSCVYGFKDESVLTNPVLENISSEQVLLQTLELKARALQELSRNQRDSDYETAALSTYNLASQLIDKIRTGYKAESSKLNLSKEAYTVYQDAVGMCIDLYKSSADTDYLNAAFRFSEKNKASILSDALQESKAKNFGGIPDSVLAKEKELKIELAFYETQMLKGKQQEDDTDAIEISQTTDRFFALKREYEKFIEHLEEAYPEYYDLKYQTKAASATDIREKLDTETTIIEYFTAQNRIYIFTITNSDCEVTEVVKDSSFENTTETIRTCIQREDYSGYIRAASKLYDTLVQPIREHLDTPRLVIIPDGSLTTVPFEVLLEREIEDASTIRYSDLPYLVREYNISYAYSATLLLEKVLNRSKTENEREFIAFAPVFLHSTNAGNRATELIAANRAFAFSLTEAPLALPASRDEVLGIQDVFRKSFDTIDRISDWLFHSKSLVVLEEEASEAHLKQLPLKDYNYVHFATHGFANRSVRDLSGLIFAQDSTSDEDNVLFLDEIYNLELNADLVTLSACESGVGQLVQGEGLLSMSRSFLYAGARNLLVSLWQTDDRSTCELMLAFYRNLVEGHSKVTALRKAKLEMLENPIHAIPSHWAAFVLIGE